MKNSGGKKLLDHSSVRDCVPNNYGVVLAPTDQEIVSLVEIESSDLALVFTKDLKLTVFFTKIQLNDVTIVTTACNKFWEVLEIFCDVTDLGVFPDGNLALNFAYFWD